MDLNLFDDQGRRKYINAAEREAFVAASKEFTGRIMTLGLVMVYTGCRISEAINLQVRHIDQVEKAITFRTLKKHTDKKIFRQVPIPDDLLTLLKAGHDLNKAGTRFLWVNNRGEQISRTTATSYIKKIFDKAEIKPPANQAKALRHGFAIHALQKGVPLNQVSKWLGHSSITTTAIYANALGEEERNLAAKMW
jgi:integrase/recombinase XerD